MPPAKKLGKSSRRTPRGRGAQHVDKERCAKARNHSRAAKAHPHSKGIAYKPPCDETAMCRRVGRMGPISVDGPGHYNPVRSEGPWGRATLVARTAVLHPSSIPTPSGVVG